MFDLLKSLSVALKYVVGFGCLQRLPAVAPDRSDVPEYDAGKCVGCKLCARAFAEAVNGDVRALFNHDPNHVLGRTSAGTLTLSEDENGLRFEISAPDASWARDLHASVQRGDINQCSFAFDVIEDEWRHMAGAPDRRTLKKVRLYDVSIVTYPAYQATSVSARHYAPSPNEKLRKKLRLREKAR